MKIIKTASGKKTIKISKKEWQSIGKIAGWHEEYLNRAKQAQMKVVDYEFNDSENVTLNIEEDGWLVDVNCSLSFDFESAQNGGHTDPSWPAHYTYAGCEIISTKLAEEQDRSMIEDISADTNEILKQAAIDAETYLDSIEDSLALRYQESKSERW